jgi:2-polyprenyl-3-methyl-5-hydroxy-6-metoxy-1,4-benzoquinol methylase
MSEALRNCPICNATPSAKDRIGPLQTNHHNIGGREYDLTNCPVCELIYLSPAPTEADIHAMYADSSQFDQDEVYRGERATAAVDFYTDRLRALLVKMNRKEREKVRLLEIGAGLSWMCRAAKRLNPESITVAQDITPEVVQECTWVDHYCIEELATSRGVEQRAPYDVISLTHVIEHLREPLAVLRRIRQLIAPGGLVFITAPHRPVGWSQEVAIEKWREWSYNHVPAHIQYFSEESMNRGAHGTGFGVALWNSEHEDGQAFEAWLQPVAGGWRRLWNSLTSSSNH